MNDKLDELAKNMAQSVTRRGALKKFGAGIAGIALGALVLPTTAEAKWVCTCVGPTLGCKSTHGGCYQYCLYACS